jgi:hypothetical protein
MNDETMREAKRRQPAHREQQLADAWARREAAEQADPPSDEAISQAGGDWLRGEVDRLRARRPTIREREPEADEP